MVLESKKFEHAPERGYSLSTLAIHADDHVPKYADIAPAIHTATNYRYSEDPKSLVAAADRTAEEAPGDHIYSRFSIENTSRLETLLAPILKGNVITYSSGLAAFNGLLVHLNPKVLAIGQAYHGNHEVAKLMSRLSGLKTVPISGPNAFEGVGKGDLVHLETPINPTGECLNIEYFAEEAHKRGAFLSVDATFSPPPLCDPFKHGADVIVHSGTKYVGGHSDLLCGILVVKDPSQADTLRFQRGILGSVMGNLEGWLGIRSTRTLGLRVERASKNATELVRWLAEEVKKGGAVGKVVKEVRHASVQKDGAGEDGWLKKQMPNGFGPCFVFLAHTEEQAKALPSKLDLFHHATSLGGVESLIEWRAMSDEHVERTLLRVSVGCEDVNDLKADLLQACEALAK